MTTLHDAYDHATAVEHIKTLIKLDEICQLQATLRSEEHGDTELIFWLDDGYFEGEGIDRNDDASDVVNAISNKSEKLIAPLYGNCVVTAMNPSTREVASLPSHALETLTGLFLGRIKSA